MASKYYQQHPDRSQFADAGLMIALAVIVVTVIKLALYGFTIVTLAWLAVALIYMAVAAASKPKSALRNGFTAFFMVFSLGAVYASFFYDYPIVPKRESNIRAEQEEQQTQDKNRQIKVDTPKPVQVETDVVSEDPVNYEEVSNVQQHDNYDVQTDAQDEDDEEIELIDLSANSDADNSKHETQNNNSQEDIIEEPVQEQFDESFE